MLFDIRSSDIRSLETPVPLVDLDRLERNIARVARYTMTRSLRCRPHVKTHKATFIASQQIESGAIGLSCATPRELEVMSGVAGDLLLAYPAVSDVQCRRLMLLPLHVDLTVALDSRQAVDQLARAAAANGRVVRVLVECDAGMHRVGVTTTQDAIDVIRAVERHASLEYRGIAFYPGHIRAPVAEQGQQMQELDRWLNTILASLADAGLSPRVVSGGSTPTLWRSHELTGITEVRPGTYVYNDRTTAQIGACEWDDCALTILTTVVSSASRGQVVIDAGAKALGREPMRGAEGEGYGMVLDQPTVVVQRMSEEHGILDLRATSWRPAVGDRVRIIPNHVCIAVHLHEYVYGVRGEAIANHWPVEARGRVAA